MMLFRREVVIGLLFGHINLQTISAFQVQNQQHQRLRVHYEPTGDQLTHSDKDVTAYTDAIIKGSKFVDVDRAKGDLMKTEEENTRNPYFMAMDRDEIIEAHKIAVQKETESEEQEELDVDLTDANGSELIQLKAHDNPWDTMIQIEHMTDSVTKKNEIKEPVNQGPTPEDMAKKRAAEQQKIEQKAIDEARNELLAPEPLDHQALQTSEAMKNGKKSGSELENDKMAEIMAENKEYTDAPAKKKSKDGRASITSVLDKDSQGTADETGDAPVRVNDVLNQDAESQQERNRKTMESLASSMVLDAQGEEVPQQQPTPPAATNKTTTKKVEKVAQQNSTKQANKPSSTIQTSPTPSSEAKIQTQTEDLNTQPVETPITSLSSNAASVIDELQKEALASEAKPAIDQQSANITIVVPAPAPEPVQAPLTPAVEPLPTLAVQEVAPQPIPQVVLAPVITPALVQAPVTPAVVQQPAVVAPAAPQRPKFNMDKFKQDVAQKLMAIKAQKKQTAAVVPIQSLAVVPAPAKQSLVVTPKPVAVVKQGGFKIVKKKPPPLAQFLKATEKKPTLAQQIGKPAVQSEVVKPVIKIKTKTSSTVAAPAAAIKPVAVAPPAPVVTQSVVQKAQSPIASAPSTQPNIAPKAQAATGTASIGDVTAAESLAALPAPPAPLMKGELSVAQKAAKDKLENPTVDADGQHLMTVEESRIITRVNLLAAKLGVAAKSGDENLSPEALTSALIERASKAGKTSQEIEDALKD